MSNYYSLKHYIMKKFVSYILSAVFIITLNSCDSESNDATIVQKIAAVSTEPTAVEKIVKNNSFIDIDINHAAKQAAMGTRATDTEEMAKAKAAIYRFYSHVRLNESKQYECTLTSAKEINISQNLFEALLQNLEAMNSFIKEGTKSGQNVVAPEITEEYLNSLLK